MHSMDMQAIGQAYDQMAERYLANRARLKSDKYVHKLLKYLPKQTTILDLGCGAGIPIDDILLKAGHEVIGLDISRQQIKLARKNCPRGQYLVQDIATLKKGAYQAQAIVSFYALFHIPRSQHGIFLQILTSFLPKGGMLLITMGDREFEGNHVLYGASLWSSQYGTIKNRAIVVSAGFDIILDEIDVSGGERHQIILAVKD